MILTNLEKERKERGVTAAHIARVAGISASAFANYEKGLRTPPIDVARRIADAIGLPLDKVFPPESKASAVGN